MIYQAVSAGKTPVVVSDGETHKTLQLIHTPPPPPPHPASVRASPTPEMDPSLLLMLSNLLHLQTTLDPNLPTPPTTTPAPLLLFTLFSILSHAATTSTLSTSPSPPPPHPLFRPLLSLLSPHLLHLPFPPSLALSLSLSRLASGSPLSSVCKTFAVPASLASKSVNSVTRLLSTRFFRGAISFPSPSPPRFPSLPNAVAAIDASHIRLASDPDPGSSSYVSRHGYPAILLQVVADRQRRFLDACVLSPGSVSDVAHFRQSKLYSRLKSGELFSGGGQLGRPPCLIGDWGFPLLSFLMTPFTPDGTGNSVQNGFDAALMRAREASVVSAVELLKGRWKILRELDVKIEHAAQTVVACCVLHNMWLMEEEKVGWEIGGLEEDGWEDPRENAPVAEVTEDEKCLHQFGVMLRENMAEDLHKRGNRSRLR